MKKNMVKSSEKPMAFGHFLGDTTQNNPKQLYKLMPWISSPISGGFPIGKIVKIIDSATQVQLPSQAVQGNV